MKTLNYNEARIAFQKVIAASPSVEKAVHNASLDWLIENRPPKGRFSKPNVAMQWQKAQVVASKIAGFLLEKKGVDIRPYLEPLAKGILDGFVVEDHFRQAIARSSDDYQEATSFLPAKPTRNINPDD